MEKEFHIELFADGACNGNPGPMGAGVILKWGDKVKKMSVPLGQGTNNRAELLAIKAGLETCKYPERTKITVHSDSEWAVKVLLGEYIPKKNLDLINEVKVLLSKFKFFEIKWVPGHAGNLYNEEADRLARLACQQVKEGKDE